MILGKSMKVFEDILYEEEERAITGFINSSGDLEYSIYECADGGFIDLADREYDKEELLDLLVDELKFFVREVEPVILIKADNLKIYLHHTQSDSLQDVAIKLNKIAKSMVNDKNMYVISKNPDEFWKIVE